MRYRMIAIFTFQFHHVLSMVFKLKNLELNTINEMESKNIAKYKIMTTKK